MPFASADGTIAVDLLLPDELRAELAKPFGPVLNEVDLAGHLRGCRRIMAIGDMVGASLVKMGIEPDLMVYDNRTERGPCDEETKGLLRKIEGASMKADNPPGKLTAELWNAVNKAIKAAKKTKIEVSGEEDLASLACIELGDAGDCVIYGIPNQGISVIRIDDEIKRNIGDILSRMSPEKR
jgi:uncharacterized protein (UPF0218 family)